MRWSWRIARIAGIDIDIHATFLILLVWVGLVDYRRAGASATPDEPLERAMARLQGCHCHTLPVMRDHELVGILTTEKVGEFVIIESAARAGHQHDRRSAA
jgi:hypothetical protein